MLRLYVPITASLMNCSNLFIRQVQKTRRTEALKSRRKLRTSVTVLAGAALILGLAACGAGGPGTSGSTSGGNQGVLKEDSTVTIEQWRADLDGCMKEAGFDMGSGNGPSGSVDVSGFDMDAFEKEYTACIKKVGDAPVDENIPTEEEIFETQLVFAKCM